MCVSIAEMTEMDVFTIAVSPPKKLWPQSLTPRLNWRVPVRLVFSIMPFDTTMISYDVPSPADDWKLRIALECGHDGMGFSTWPRTPFLSNPARLWAVIQPVFKRAATLIGAQREFWRSLVFKIYPESTCWLCARPRPPMKCWRVV